MRRTTKAIALVLAVLCLLSNVLIVPLAAAEKSVGDEPQPKKIVSVMYDNSKSMKADKTAHERRYEYALYAIQVLIALMGPEDELVINPLNVPSNDKPSKGLGPPIENRDHRFAPTLTETKDKTRDDVLQEVMSSDLFKSPPAGETPSGSLQFAIEELTEKGMRTKNEVKPGDADDTQYWLVILSDGPFNQPADRDKDAPPLTVDEFVRPYIEPYASLQTIYLAFGEGFSDEERKDLLGCGLPSFTPYVAKDSSEVIAAMEQVSNQLTGRYSLSNDKFEWSADKKKVTIDLAKVGQTLNSVSVIGQDCGVELESATLNGKALEVTQKCVLRPHKDLKEDASLKMKDGFSAVIQTDGRVNRGIVELTFTGRAPDDLVVLVEPALRLEGYIEYQDENGNWIEADTPTLCGKCLPGDKARMGYRVYDLATGLEVKLKDMFQGAIETEVTYDDAKCAVGEPFALVAGNNEAVVKVSMNNGGYQLHDSVMCIILADHNDYRVEHRGPTALKTSEGAADIVFTVYDKTVNASGALTRAQLSEGYEWSVSARYDKTGEAVAVRGELQADGSVSVTFRPEDARLYGDYTVEMTVISEHGIPATAQHTIKYVPDSLLILPTKGDGMAISKNELKLQKDAAAQGYPDYKPLSITFEAFVKLDEETKEPLPLDDPQTQYSLWVDGKDITAVAVEEGAVTVSGDRLIYTPTASNLGGAAEETGKKNVKLVVRSGALAGVQGEGTAALNVGNTSYIIEVVEEDGVKADRFDLIGSNAVLHFRVRCDGVPVPREHLEAACAAGEIAVTDKGTFSRYWWLPCGREYAIVPAEGDSGLIEVRMTQDMPEVFAYFLSVFITNGAKPIEVTYKTSNTAVGEIVFEPSPAWVYIVRGLILIAILAVATYLIVFALGFFPCLSKCKPLPRGRLIVLQLGAMPSSTASVSIRRIKVGRAKWHWMRFNPLDKQPLLSNQRDDTTYQGSFQIRYNSPRGGDCKLIPTKEIRSLEPREDSAEYQLILKLVSAVRAGNPTKPHEVAITRELAKKIRGAFKVGELVVPNRSKSGEWTNPQSLTSYYGIQDKGLVTTVFIFVKAKR